MSADDLQDIEQLDADLWKIADDVLSVGAIQFRLIDLTGISPRPMMEQTIGQRVRLSEETPEALVQGYGEALGQILSELGDGLATAR
jgi:hypothetical protein